MSSAKKVKEKKGVGVAAVDSDDDFESPSTAATVAHNMTTLLANAKSSASAFGKDSAETTKRRSQRGGGAKEKNMADLMEEEVFRSAVAKRSAREMLAAAANLPSVQRKKRKPRSSGVKQKKVSAYVFPLFSS